MKKKAIGWLIYFGILFGFISGAISVSPSLLASAQDSEWRWFPVAVVSGFMFFNCLAKGTWLRNVMLVGIFILSHFIAVQLFLRLSAKDISMVGMLFLVSLLFAVTFIDEYTDHMAEAVDDLKAKLKTRSE